ncbi:glycosyltransferase family 1 protein [Lepidopterella palustris CBS 459.81]|uniref:UDP-N-acetylglucosamine transferase subunit ALG14 n=1 Tax=Lepidopterella palustris CBS 459.81 TaxID=1314670 RepID=A0A8E2EDT3_9PEZI|nr:glycosyltransferase family 1 protein [Lepidopterella palustris CBS 459.81]
MAPSPALLLTLPAFLLTAALAVFLTASLRLLALLPSRRPHPPKRSPGTPTRLLVVLGSGGHTAEMLALLRTLDPQKYTHRTYVVSSGDSFSAERAMEFEKLVGLKAAGRERDGRVAGERGQGLTGEGGAGVGSYDIAIVPRARRIHQSLLSTPWSALRCLWSCFAVLRAPSAALSLPKCSGAASIYGYPDLILTNGPATAVIVILASLILRFFGVGGANARDKMRTIYVESWARVTRLSLSGKLLVKVVDRFLVQWEGLEGVGGRGEFFGVLV